VARPRAFGSGASTTLPRSTHDVLCSDGVTGRRQIIGVAMPYGHEGLSLEGISRGGVGIWPG
jgi:hypothetical protein